MYFLGFDLAKVMLRENARVSSLSGETVEEICLSCSREFYDNAASGNYKVGDMKLAYDWYVMVLVCIGLS